MLTLPDERGGPAAGSMEIMSDDPAVRATPKAPISRRRVSERHPQARRWSNVVVPVCLVLLLAGLGAVLYTGRSRGGLSRAPTRAEVRRDLCRQNLETLGGVWKSAGSFPEKLWHAHWGGQDGLGCANDDGAPYALRDFARCPVGAARADEPIAVCLGLAAATTSWRPPHDVALVLYADGTVRDVDWDDLGLPGHPPAGASPPVVGPESPSPVLRVLRAQR